MVGIVDTGCRLVVVEAGGESLPFALWYRFSASSPCVIRTIPANVGEFSPVKTFYP